MAKLVILGATGTIGKSLVFSLSSRGKHELVLVGRDKGKLTNLVQAVSGMVKVEIAGMEDLANAEGDAIVNCLGAGDPGTIRAFGADLIKLTKVWDERILQQLNNNRNCLCVSFSSGVVHGSNREAPVPAASQLAVATILSGREYYYSISKLDSENRHRAAKDLNVVDLRLFGYVTRHLNPASGYFLSDVMTALRTERALKTSVHDMVRDYAHPDDVADLIELCLEARPINRAFDVYTKRPVSKFEVLEALDKKFGLKWDLIEDAKLKSDSISKSKYYSLNHDAETIGFHPQFTAIDGVMTELAGYLQKREC